MLFDDYPDDGEILYWSRIYVSEYKAGFNNANS